MDINFFKVNSMPATPTADSVYFVKSGSGGKIYVTDSTGTPIGMNSTDAVVNSVNDLNGNVQLELSLSGGSLSITGGTTPVNLDNRYLKTTDNISWSKITGHPTTLGGYGISDAYTKSEVTAITGSLSNLNTSTKASLVAAINELNTALADQLDVPNPIDCSTNPNYPASNKGDTYKVTAAGKIGGANGVNVGVGDLIICTANTSGGDQATAGDNFFVVESNVDMATESVAGIGRIATQAEVTAGENATAWVTPATLAEMGYLTSFSETDPIFSASPAGGISSTDITNWDAKVDPTRKIIAGSGLTGGGDLSADRTLAIDPTYSGFTNYYTNGYINTNFAVRGSRPKSIAVGDVRQQNDFPATDGTLGYMPAPNSGVWNKSVTGVFSGDYGGGASAGSILTIAGWNIDIGTSKSYAAWQISASAYENVKDGPFFRLGAGSVWDDWKKMLIEGDSISLLNNDAGFLSSETDPIFSASPAAGITNTNITNWNNAASKSHDELTLGTAKNGLSLSGQELQLALATTSAAGAMSSADKSKLNGIAANANNYTLPKASASTLGGIKVGNNLSIDANGVLSASDSTYSAGVGLDLDAGEFSLLPATAAALGGVKVGTRLSITAGGTLSADNQMVWASTEW